MLRCQGFLAVIKQLSIFYVGLCRGDVRLRSRHICLRFCNLLRTAARQQSRHDLLVSSHFCPVLSHRIQKALLHQLGDELTCMDRAAFIHQQLVNTLTVVPDPHVILRKGEKNLSGSAFFA